MATHPAVDIHAHYYPEAYYERPVDVITRLAGISRADKTRIILGGTAAKLLHLN